MRSVNEIRELFLSYFAKNDHEIIKSSSLIPQNDPTLMFTNSGMVQFKNYFTQDEVPKFKRATSSQKCVRAGGKHNDLDNVGYTARHHTFFEMLGNFSFADYFKEQAIFYAWDFIIKELGINRDRLYITIFHEDNEAESLWKKIANLKDDRIIKIKTSDNFWSMGDSGPCGPCTEIFYDHGPDVFGGLPGTKYEDGDRYVEIWNLVFMQFLQFADGKRIALPKPCVDTGSGIERVAAALQGVHNNYEIDLFSNIITNIADKVKVKPADEALVSYRVIADHLRSCSFLIADGVMPSNEGRGYVLRRIMRRAMRHVHQLGYKDPLMYQLVKTLIDEMGHTYTELTRAEGLLKEIWYQEELKFRNTLSKGLKLLDEELSKIGFNKTLSGDVAFKLYDTYGFPLDLTVDILRSQDLQVDNEGFDQSMQQQKEKAKAAWKGSGDVAVSEEWFNIYNKHGATDYLGYELNSSQGVVLEVIHDGTPHAKVVTNQTPFYGESGGQVGDQGYIIGNDGKKYKVIDTKKYLGKVFAHILASKEAPKQNENVTLIIDVATRDKIRANHSATHLLQYVLRNKFGSHITQKGSLVSAERLRFDFSSPKGFTAEEIYLIEADVNNLIRKNSETNIKLVQIEKAIEQGAMALFGEKYDDEVRVVSMCDSIELCGGTHVSRTGDIGLFKIFSESAVAAGVRRIEALTGEEALKFIQRQDNVINNMANTLKCPVTEIEKKIEAVLKENKAIRKDLEVLNQKSLLASIKDIKGEEIGSVTYIGKVFDNISPNDLRNLVDSLRQSISNVIILALASYEDKTSMIVALNDSIKDKFDASLLIKEAMEAAGGKGGGGRKEIAQAGGFDIKNSQKAIDKVKEIIEKKA
jgi:alanyl-tRNA synthetase